MLFYQKHYPRWQTWFLRLMFGIVSAAKMPVWTAAYFWPGTRQRPMDELRSNLDILRMCLQPGVVPPH